MHMMIEMPTFLNRRALSKCEPGNPALATPKLFDGPATYRHVWLRADAREGSLLPDRVQY